MLIRRCSHFLVRVFPAAACKMFSAMLCNRDASQIGSLFRVKRPLPVGGVDLQQ